VRKLARTWSPEDSCAAGPAARHASDACGRGVRAAGALRPCWPC